jgi:hypothetical protein
MDIMLECESGNPTTFIYLYVLLVLQNLEMATNGKKYNKSTEMIL